MTLGLAPKQGDLLRTTVDYCEGRVAPDSIYGVLHRECFTLLALALHAIGVPHYSGNCGN